MGLFSFLFGSSDKTKQVPTMNSQQQQVLSSILSQLGIMGGQEGTYGMAQSNLQDLLSNDSQAYDKFSAPYLRQFNEQTIPQLSERFAGLGALNSSGFGQALGAAGAGLQENLASLRGGLQQNAIQSALGQYTNLASLGLGAQPFGYQTQKGSSGFLPSLAGSALQGYFGRM